ncbi:hypothetical protein CBR_g48294 [Chara braunii]|uniref:Uncharacterized protein n=1 Tax=Chara braunii TaxID=69332 RepID=A0A388K484_CHABU|nr:hypothetical protein CBR_g48294 [Chara braunii]|eukprot:GBG64826.1 hypothetical protein CBR_g48294 [Chara braunii]
MRRERTVLPFCDAVLQVCYAMGCGAFPRATPRWWMKRRTGGTWEDLLHCDDATADYFKDKLRMSPGQERRLQEKKDREDHYKQIGDLINARLGAAEDAKNSKKSDSGEVDRLRYEVENLKKLHSAAVHTSLATVNNHDEAVRLQREYDEAKRQAQEASERRISALEDQVHTLKKITEEAVSEAEGWKMEAQRPGNKRGCIAIGATPSPQVRTRSRVAPAATPVTARRRNADDYSDLVTRHMEEVKILKEMRIKEFNRRREAEQEAERIKEDKDREIERLKVALSRVQVASLEKLKASRMKALEKHIKTGGTDLRHRLKAAVCEGAQCSDKGKAKAAVADEVGIANEREMFLKGARKDLKNLKKDAIQKICEKEGVSYTVLDETREAIAQLRTRLAYDEPPPGKEKEVVIEVLPDNSDGNSADLGKADEADESTS